MWRGWRDALARLGFATAALDAKLLTGHALGLDALDLARREHEPVPLEAVGRVADLLQRRMSGESVARLIGEREFYGLSFGLNSATLEPRPDTELLVDLAIKALPSGGRLLDLGTGTGCVPIAILANRTDASGLATDLSPEALEMAQANAARNGVGERLDFALGDWFAAVEAPPALIPPHKGEGDDEHGTLSHAHPSPRWGGTEGGVGSQPRGPNDCGFDLITSNPPYITSAVIETLAPEVKDFDPRLALDGGPDGLAPYRIIAAEAGRFLKPGGQVLVEIGYDQGASVAALFGARGFSNIAVHRDLGGLDRVVVAHHLSGS
ncbi:N5-glutamine methyltransferase family protein [Devosia ureilytica]|uniref:N5-glutamine methyltransferase family protein n=1 Tax=Devosia ureilytica TaxID=2952754 RepID=UPI0022B27A19|nr:peptide chain release factor N(5)-glutamine methyltransferase [Devosia ureilytica]